MDHSKLAHVHAHMQQKVVSGEELFLPEKSYKNATWLNSHGAKTLRILSEIIEPEQRFAAAGVKNTILFFGSARAKSPENHAIAVKKSEAVLADPAASEAEKEKHRVVLDRLHKMAWMCDIYTVVADLSRRLTEWSMSRIGATGAGVPYVISTGGGPGLMEAANCGAAQVPGAISAGIAISLPFEQGLNKYVTPELGFQHHYFFSRKLALCAPTRALVATAGGFGTCDELFEVLTLMQTGKIEHPETMPVVLMPGSYWKKAVDWDYFVETGVIAAKDLDLLYFTDDADDAFRHITGKLLQWELKAAAAAAEAAEAAKHLALSAAAAAHEAFLLAHRTSARAAATLSAKVLSGGPYIEGALVESTPVPAGVGAASPAVTIASDALLSPSSEAEPTGVISPA